VIRRAALLVAFALVVSACGGSTASPRDDATSWDEIVRGFEAGDDDNVCTRGEIACIDAVLTEMRRRFDELVARCDHVAPWALTYLRSTEGFRSLLATPGALHDSVFVTHLDVRFAQLYFRAYDNWYGGRKAEVSEPWQIVFDAADNKGVAGIGSMMLAINAHISRDLPVALAQEGLSADASAKRADFRTANKVFETGISQVIGEVAARFDPAVAAANIPGVAADEQAILAMIAGWREASLANGERLGAAGPNRSSVQAQIDAGTAAESLGIRAATSYIPFVSGPQARDAFCRQHGKG
jgi:hypothetical protein